MKSACNELESRVVGVGGADGCRSTVTLWMGVIAVKRSNCCEYCFGAVDRS